MRCGIDARTPDPDGGAIERDDVSGEPTGVLREGPALWLVEQHAPRLTTAEMARAIAVMGQRYWEAGITSILDPALTPREMRAYSHALAHGEPARYGPRCCCGSTPSRAWPRASRCWTTGG